MALSNIQQQAQALSFADLKKLRVFIDGEMEQHEKKARTDLIERMNAMAKESGFSDASAVFSKPEGKKKRAPVAPKYRNPQDPEQTWSGRGRRPKWVQELIESGGTVDDALIEA